MVLIWPMAVFSAVSAALRVGVQAYEAGRMRNVQHCITPRYALCKDWHRKFLQADGAIPTDHAWWDPNRCGDFWATFEWLKLPALWDRLDEGHRNLNLYLADLDCLGLYDLEHVAEVAAQALGELPPLPASPPPHWPATFWNPRGLPLEALSGQQPLDIPPIAEPPAPVSATPAAFFNGGIPSQVPTIPTTFVSTGAAQASPAQSWASFLGCCRVMPSGIYNPAAYQLGMEGLPQGPGAWEVLELLAQGITGPGLRALPWFAQVAPYLPGFLMDLVDPLGVEAIAGPIARMPLGFPYNTLPQGW